MNNPIFSGFRNRPNQTNQQSSQFNQPTLFGLINQIRNSPNPNAAMQNVLSSNPQYQNVINYINQNGGDAKTAFYNLAAQKGVDPNTILKQLR